LVFIKPGADKSLHSLSTEPRRRESFALFAMEWRDALALLLKEKRNWSFSETSAQFLINFFAGGVTLDFSNWCVNVVTATKFDADELIRGRN
jgi:hypothetical protein